MYEPTTPFAGWIRFVDQVDVDQVADGSTKKERYVQLLAKYPTSVIKQFPLGDLPDPEAVKYDVVSRTFIPLLVTDITPKAQAVLDQAEKAQDYIDNLPSWSAVSTAVDNITTIAGTKAFLKKLARVVYWDVKNSKD